MSAKVPVGPTINEAFRFGWKRSGSVLRFMWLPVLLSVILLAGVIGASIDFEAARAAKGEAQQLADILKVPTAAFFGMLIVSYVAAAFVVSGGAASIYRLVVHGEERPGLFQLRFDGPAMRTFLAFVILGLISVVLSGVGIAVASLLTKQSLADAFKAYQDYMSYMMTLQGGQPDLDIVKGFQDRMKVFDQGSAIAAIPSIYLAVKLMPFPAGSAAENRLLLLGSFSKTFGHAWSIFFGYVLLIIAMVLVFIVAALGVAALGVVAGFLAQSAPIFGAVIGFVIFGGLAWLAIFASGVFFAFSGVIYRRLAYGE